MFSEKHLCKILDCLALRVSRGEETSSEVHTKPLLRPGRKIIGVWLTSHMTAARCEPLRYLTNMPSSMILRAATSGIFCEAALNKLANPVLVGEQDSYAKYELTPTCAEIARKAHRVSGTSMPARNEG